MAEEVEHLTALFDVVEGGGQDDVALVEPGRLSLTYQDLVRDVFRTAASLAGHGIRAGDRVALAYPNSAEAIVLFLGASLAATAAPLNPAYKEDEFRFYLQDTGARVLLVPPGGGQAARAGLPEGGLVIEAAYDSEGWLGFEPIGAAANGGEPELAGGDAIALVLHTSGTTSRPKRVPLRHRNLLASVDNIVATYRLGPGDVSLAIMPLFHVHGLVASTLATFRSGGKVVVAAFNPMGFWPLVSEFRPTWWSASPSPLQLSLARARGRRPDGLDRLRFVRSCSSALQPALMAEMESLYEAPVLEAYGMTEASHQMASNPLPPEARQPGSVGRGTGVEIAVMGGEVVIRGPNVMDGYEQNPAANAEAFADGWFRTGDVGSLDESGYLTLAGRIKELINRGGEKIAPLEIDQLLEAHPAVREAVVFGVPHPTWGEEVAAAVVTSEPVTARELQAWCRDRLADFKVPKTIHLVDAIPRTATGKIQRRTVAAAFTDG